MSFVLIPRTYATTVTANGALRAGKHNPADATGGNLTLTLPTPVDPGAYLSVEKIDASTNTITISGSIRGATSSISLAWRFETIEMHWDGATWHPISGHKTKAALDAAYGGGAGNMRFQNTWIASHAYNANDVVTYNGSAYVCLVTHTSGSTFSGPGTNWALLVRGVTSGTTPPSAPLLHDVWIDES